jgi:hypothetical protein
MLLTIAHEIGNEIAKEHSESPDSKKRMQPGTLVRLHARSCQVVAEIVTLLENGYADGAMARWRTLYEIGVVARIIAEGGEDIAKRYVEHRAIEAKSELEEYQQCCVILGYKPISKQNAKRIERRYAEAIRKFGSEFKSQYGWALPYLRRSRPRPGKNWTPAFRDLEVAAGRAAMRSHYKLACHNVHAGPHSIFFRLGLLGDNSVLLAGPSNAGFVEPGQNAALTLTQITTLLLAENHDLDTIVWMNVLVELCGDVSRALVRADTKLRRDEAKVSNMHIMGEPVSG